jgi:hypothetical protein
MITFAFGTLHPKLNITPVLSAISLRLKDDFGLNVEIARLDDPELLKSRQELVLVDVSRDLQSLHISGLGKISRLFVFQSGPAKIAGGLKQFLQSLSIVHGEAVRFVFDRPLDEESVYQVESKLRQPSFGFHPGDDKNPPDVRELSSALFQEYYTLRLEQLKQARIAHILHDLANEAIHHTEIGTPASVPSTATGSAGPPAESSPAQRYLENVLQTLKVPFHVKFLFFRYIAMRASMGQSLPDAVEELLPMVMLDNAFEAMSVQFRMEHEVNLLVRPPG